MAFLKALCAVAEGAEVTFTGTAHAAGTAAALGDPLRRLCVMGGRVGMARSLGSVNAGSVVRFLGGFRGKESRRIYMFCHTWCNNVAVTRDGNTLLVSSSSRHVIRVSDVSTGRDSQAIGTYGREPLQFDFPHQLWIAPDGDVFVADTLNHRIQVLTCRLDFRTFIGASQLRYPKGVCADERSVYASEVKNHRIAMFRRSDGALLRRFGCHGSGDGELDHPSALCVMGTTRRIAVTDFENHRISVFSTEGVFDRHVSAGELCHPHGIACTETGHELIVTTCGCRRTLLVLRDSGELLHKLKASGVYEKEDVFTSIAMHGDRIFAHLLKANACVVFT